MTATQTINYRPTYAFLSRPPQKKRPTQPLPPTPSPASPDFRSNIARWAAHVQPGSPGSPHSPRRRTSLSRRPSVSSRRPSITITRTPSGSFLHVIDTPTSPTHRTCTPSVKEFDVDLTNLGYTSVFVHLPKTPTTPSPYLRAAHTNTKPMVNPDSFPIPESRPPRIIKRFRSLSILRSRNTTKSSATSPPSPTKSAIAPSKPKKHQPPPQICAATIAKRKKAVYAYASKAKHHTPAPLANELALMQFADGGSMDANIKRLMEAQARAAAGSRAAQEQGLSVGDVYRDGKGGIWWDREEEMEYAHLLDGGPDADEETKWVAFDAGDKDTSVVMMDTREDEDPALALASLAGLGRRGSNTSTQTRDSDLDPCNIVRPAEEDAGIVHMPMPVPVPRLCAPPPGIRPRKTHAQPILSLPSRPRAHLRKNPQFLLDLAAFALPPTQPAPSSPLPRTPRTPISPRHKKSFSPVRTAFAFPSASSPIRARGKARRRPAPLKLVVPPSLSSASSTTCVALADDGKRDFLQASFAPSPGDARIVHTAATTPAAVAAAFPPALGSMGASKTSLALPRGLGKKKASRLDLRFGGLFGRKE